MGKTFSAYAQKYDFKTHLSLGDQTRRHQQAKSEGGQLFSRHRQQIGRHNR